MASKKQEQQENEQQENEQQDEQQQDEEQQSSSGHSGAGTAVKAVAAAAATGAAALAAKKVMSGRGEGSNGSSSNGDTPERQGGGGEGSMLNSVLSGGWEAARDALLPAAEDAAGAAGEYVAQHGPDILRDRIIPRFVDSFNEAREGS